MILSKQTDNDIEAAKLLLALFAQYGFRKTSMEDIAKATHVSRQSVYKKFGSKEKCYQWAIHNYLSDMYARIFALMGKEDHLPLRTLIGVFDILIGEAVEIVNNPHGTEILDDVLQATHASEEDWPLRLRVRLSDYLQRYHFVSSENAPGTAFALICASKGLLLEERSRAKFLENMTFIIKSILKTDS